MQRLRPAGSKSLTLRESFRSLNSTEACEPVEILHPGEISVADIAGHGYLFRQRRFYFLLRQMRLGQGVSEWGFSYKYCICKLASTDQVS